MFFKEFSEKFRVFVNFEVVIRVVIRLYSGLLNVVSVQVDTERVAKFSETHGIDSVPTCLFYVKKELKVC